MTARFVSGTNTFIPQFDASGKLIVEFSRDPKSFAVTNYTQIRPVKRGEGYYLRMSVTQAGRIRTTDGSQFDWHDGNDADLGEWNRERFAFFPYFTKRKNYPFLLGYKAVDQADWQIMASYAAIAAQQAMTQRTQIAVSTLTTSANYDTGHFSTATALAGGFLSAGSPTNPILKIALRKAAQQIHQDTWGVVQPKDMVVVIGPDVAAAIAESQEVHTYLKENPVALQVIEKGLSDNMAMWGIPNTLYGYRIVVEDTVGNNVQMGETDSRAYLLSNNLIMVARPGSIVSSGGGADFGAAAFFMFEEMTVETKDDPDNRRHKGRVVEDYDFQLAAPAGAYLITHALS